MEDNYSGVQPNIPFPDEEDSYGAMSPPVYDSYNDGSEIGIIKELSPKKVLEQLRMNLKGKYFDTEKKE